MDLPIKVEAILFSKKDGGYKFLLLKRCPEDGGFWQPLTGTLEDGEKLMDCLKREILEEIGLEKIKNVTDEIFRFDWKNKKGQAIVELVYGVELNPDDQIKLSNEHTDYQWCDFDQALNIMEKENNKNSFKEFSKIFVLK